MTKTHHTENSNKYEYEKGKVKKIDLWISIHSHITKLLSEARAWKFLLIICLSKYKHL